VILREFLIAYIKMVMAVVIFTVSHLQGEAEITVLLLLRELVRISCSLVVFCYGQIVIPEEAVPSGDDISKVHIAPFVCGSCCTLESAVDLLSPLLSVQVLSSPFCGNEENNRGDK